LFISNFEEIKLPKIIVMNITPENIDNCIKECIHGIQLDSGSVGNAEKLERGDICIIRQTSGGGHFNYGVVGIWYFFDKEDITGQVEPFWDPPHGWKYKIFMRPLIRKFNEPFNEDFSIEIEGQLKQKKSTKVSDLKQIDIQGIINIGFNDIELPHKYLKAILREKKDECNINVEYENASGIKWNINVHDFLYNLAKNIYDIKISFKLNLNK